MSGVSTLVGVERGGESEAFTARVTLERAFSGVAVDMGLHIALLVEALSTVRTVVHPLLRVGPHVIRQMRQLFEPTAALLALVGLLACVRR